VTSSFGRRKFQERTPRRNIVTAAFAVALGLGSGRVANAQEAKPQSQITNKSSHSQVPEIVVTAPKSKVAAKPQRRTTRAAVAAPAPAPNPQPPTEVTAGYTGGGPPLQQTALGDKTGTKIGDLPQSVVIVPRSLAVEQSNLSVATAISRDVSGVNQGGSSSYGFFDRFTIRGMDARIYEDNFPDGDQSNGLPHSLNGVEHIEVLKGPGSALFGTSTPGGTVNIVHFLPSSVPGYGLSTQLDSYGGWYNSIYATGPTGVPGLNYRVDGLLQYSDGFRGLKNNNYELRPEWSWTKDNHFTVFALDVRHIERTPDGYGIVYVNGPPLGGVPSNTKYSTPFSYGNQDFARGTLTDAWWLSDVLTINNRLAYTYRDVSILRNSGGTVVLPMLTNRQLREQTDLDNDAVYQFEPVWRFATGTIGHTLLTGAQAEWDSIDDDRATASLPNIANIYAPVIPETSVANLTFLRDQTHSGMIDDLRALYLSAYCRRSGGYVRSVEGAPRHPQGVLGRNARSASLRTRPRNLRRNAARTGHDANRNRHAVELEHRHALQNPARRGAVRRRIEKLPHQLQFGNDSGGPGRSGIRARIRDGCQALDAGWPLHAHRRGV
jgi:iron complex outermembrane recepter protein